MLIRTLRCLLIAATVSAQARHEAGLELVLRADAPGTVDAEELVLQRLGYAVAMTGPQVVAAIRNSIYGNVAVTQVEWASNTAVIVS